MDQFSYYVLFTEIIYFVIALGFSVFFRSYKNIIFWHLISASSFLSAVVVVFSFVFIGMSSWDRMTIPVYSGGVFSYFPDGYESSSDPNVLGYFLGLGLLTLIFLKGKTKPSKFYDVMMLFVLFSLFLTMSRSAILAFFVATFIYIFMQLKLRIKASQLARAFAILLGFLVVFFLVFNSDEFFEIVYSRVNSEASNSDRLDRLALAFDLIFDSWQVFLFGSGLGVSRDTVDPHNFFLSTLLDVGFFALVIKVFILFYALFRVVLVSSSKQVISYSVAVLIYFFIISLFYWQVRTYYFVLTILLVSFFGQTALQKHNDFR